MRPDAEWIEREADDMDLQMFLLTQRLNGLATVSNSVADERDLMHAAARLRIARLTVRKYMSRERQSETRMLEEKI